MFDFVSLAVGRRKSAGNTRRWTGEKVDLQEKRAARAGGRRCAVLGDGASALVCGGGAVPVEAEMGTRTGSEVGSGSGWQRMHSAGRVVEGREDGRK